MRLSQPRQHRAPERHEAEPGWEPGLSTEVIRSDRVIGSEEEYWMRISKVGALAGVAVLTFAACGGGAATTAPSGSSAPSASSGGASGGASPSAAGGTDKGTVKIAIELPLQGSELAAAQPIINGIRLAIKDAGGAAGGYAITQPQESVFDDAVNGAHDPQQGAKNMTSIVSDPDVVADIGPLNSSVAQTEIPVSNEGELLQCSPANTNPTLTKVDAAKQIRPAGKPNNYIRVVTTDDFQGPAAATYLYKTLGAKSVFIIDDTETFGKGIADAFEAQFKKEGGTVVDHVGVPKTTTDYASIMTAAASKNPEGIYFGGVTATGGARILKAAVAAGLTVPYVAGDGINDGSGKSDNSFLNIAGTDAKNSFSTLAGIGDFPAKQQFNEKYKAEYNTDATGYASTGYGCAQVVIDAIRRAGDKAADQAGMRVAVRDAGTDSSVTYDTILGKIQFDANGDTSQKIISIYAFDPAGADGKGDWVFKEQVDFAAAG
jgi:branched-chain amino acid transport system substrate-binding protein